MAAWAGRVPTEGGDNPTVDVPGNRDDVRAFGLNNKSPRIRWTTALMKDGGFFAPAVPGGNLNRDHQ